MRLDRIEEVAGVSMRDARDFLRTMPEEEKLGETVARARDRFGAAVNALAFINELARRNWIVRGLDTRSGRTMVCRMTRLGRKLRATRLIRPIPRAKAEAVVAAFLQRVEQVNANAELTHYVQEAHLFGGMLDQSIEMINGVELAIQLEWRTTPDFFANRLEWSLSKAQTSGLIFSNFGEKAFYGMREVMTLLKTHPAALSLYELRALKAMGARREVIFQERSATPKGVVEIRL